MGLHSTVLPFCLAINLRIRSYKESPFNAKEVTKQWPELEGKKQASIKNNWIKKVMVSNYYVKDNFS